MEKANVTWTEFGWSSNSLIHHLSFIPISSFLSLAFPVFKQDLELSTQILWTWLSSNINWGNKMIPLTQVTACCDGANVDELHANPLCGTESGFLVQVWLHRDPLERCTIQPEVVNCLSSSYLVQKKMYGTSLFNKCHFVKWQKKEMNSVNSLCAYGDENSGVHSLQEKYQLPMRSTFNLRYRATRVVFCFLVFWYWVLFIFFTFNFILKVKGATTL